MLENRKLTRSVRGFTLTEAAIVLGIVGLILSAIWVAAGSVYGNYRIGKTTEQIITIAQNIRSMYAQRPTVDAGLNNINLAAARAVPSDIVVDAAAGTLNNVWGGAVVVQANADTSMFDIIYRAVPQAACIDLLVRTTGSNRDPGLAQVGTATRMFNSAVAADIPVALQNAVAACPAATQDLTYIFRLRG